MVSYNVLLFIATGYEIGKGWVFNKSSQSEPFRNALEANRYYDDKLVQLSSIAAEHSSAVYISLSRDEEKQREFLYEGENVRFWFAAYHKPGQCPIEERFYIDRIYHDIGYYAFMYKKELHPEIEPVVIAATMDELTELLGDNIDLYERMA